MPKRVHITSIPKTPKGVHFLFNDVSADEIDVDEDISIKSTLFRSFKKQENEQKKIKLKQSPVIRKSTELKKIKNIDDRINALISSPMIEVRRRPLHSRSFNSTDIESQKTPLYVPNKSDPQYVMSRRYSKSFLSKLAPFSQSMSSLWDKESLSSLGTSTNERLSLANTDKVLQKIKNRISSGIAIQEPMNVSVDNIENQLPGVSHQDFKESTNSVEEPASISEFRILVQIETSRLTSTKTAWENVISEEQSVIPEIALNSIRAAIGKCGLLVTKKFSFFNKLIDLAESSENTNSDLLLQQKANLNDLLGYWETIASEIALIDGAFDRLRIWRETSNWSADLQPKTPIRHEETRKSKRTPSQISKESNKLEMQNRTPIRSVNISNTPKTKRLTGITKKSKLKAPNKIKLSKFAEFRNQMLLKKSKEKSDATKSPSRQQQQSIILMPTSEIKSKQLPNLKKTASGRKSKVIKTDRQTIESPMETSESNLLSSLNNSAVTKSTEHWAIPDTQPTNRVGRPRKGSLVSKLSTNEMSDNSGHWSHTPLSDFERIYPRPATGTPRPKFPCHNYSSTPAIPLHQSLLIRSLTSRKSAKQNITPNAKCRRSVWFPEVVSMTPEGHSGGSGDHKNSYSLTPHASVKDPTKRVSRTRRSSRLLSRSNTPSK